MIITIMTFLASLAIYAGYGVPGLFCLLALTAASYCTALLTPEHKFFMWVMVAVSALFLLTVKLLPLTGMEFTAPLGISYFLLRIISYNVDVYRGKYEPELNPLRYVLYVTFIPQIFLGPIERYDSFCKGFFEDRRITWDSFSGGVARLMWGLFKKLAIASRAGVIVGAISGNPEQYRGAYALLAVVMYSLQLYADFSGGIDMVLGVCRMLGAKLSENFDAPYFSQSFQEFWRRWHMTLGSWLREYIYIPLGGNRKGKVRKYVNSIVTFLVSGLWHGVHYLLWGLFNGIFVACGERFKTPVKFLNQLGTFLLVSLLWAFFVWPETMTALGMIGSVFTTFNYGALFAGIMELGLNAGEWIVLILATMLLWGYDLYRGKITGVFRKLNPAGRVAVVCGMGLVILIFGMYGIGFNAEEFIYSRF